MVEWARNFEKRSAGSEGDIADNTNSDAIVRQARCLVDKVKRQFCGKYRQLGKLRVLVHIPSSLRSPGGYSLFRNLALSLDFIGIPTRCLEWNESIQHHLADFAPTIFLSSDASEYLSRIDWEAVRCYRRSNSLRIGLTASLQEYDNTPLSGRLKWAKDKHVDFYYSFRSPEYLRGRKEYRPFFDSGYQVLSVEFGANPLFYYPIPGVERDLDYVFLASSNYDKRPRYYEYLGDIFSERVGLIDGPGWTGVKEWAPPSSHRFLYARAKVGINLHISDSIDWPSELNERTYILAACGVPQLVDDAKLLPYRFSEDAMFVAKTPREYNDRFHEILAQPDLAQARAMKALQEVFTRHTTFHRAEQLVLDLSELCGS